MPDYGFSPIIGHDQIKEVLQRAAKKRQPGHAYILEGDAGSGRRMLAKAFAMSLLCENFGGGGRPMEPCGACKSCVQFLTDNHPDVKVVTHEKASLGVEDIRAQLVNDMQIKPYEAPYKVYLVPEAEKMTAQAQNALLKTLEEPPDYGVILLMTTNADFFLPTIRSRCTHLAVRPLPDSLVLRALTKKVQEARDTSAAGLSAEGNRPEAAEKAEMPFSAEEVSETEIRMAVAFARGSIGEGWNILASGRFPFQKKMAKKLATEAGSLSVSGLLSLLKEWEAGDYPVILECLRLWYRDAILWKAEEEKAEKYLLFGEDPQLEETSRLRYESLERIVEEIDRAGARIKVNVRPENAMEILFLTLQEEYRRASVNGGNV